MTNDHSPHPRIARNKKAERLTKVRKTLPLGFPEIIDMRSSTSTAIGQAVIISCISAELFVFGCQSVSSSAKLMAQLIMGGLYRVLLIARTFDLGPFMETVG